jgi:acetyl-CoA decarbonylase/synthase complex subunit gamma
VLTFRDRLKRWLARWGIGRMTCLVPPGLYAVGSPGPADPVVVTANYRLSYDAVRGSLDRRNAWLLVLETYGINVWCAAGKGTFGTGELVRRVGVTGLERVVCHRSLILPLLGAPGISARELLRRTGFRARFAAVAAAALQEYLDNGMRTTPAMRELGFSFTDRLVLVPMELLHGVRHLLVAAGIMVLLGGAIAGFDFYRLIVPPLMAYGAALLAGAVATPLLLPCLPTRSFSVKGALSGGVTAALLFAVAGGNLSAADAAALFLVVPALAAFYGLAFTGSTPYTSRSGVKRELRIALPVIAVSLLTGVSLWCAGLFR